jgi:two-component system, sensor histidine kinase
MNNGRSEASGALPRWITHIGPIISDDATVARYAAAVGVTLVIFAIRAALAPWLGSQAPLLPFLLGILLSAYLAGRGPAFLATAITPVLATIWFTNWPMDAPPGQWLSHVAFFVLLSVITTLFMHALQLSVRRANENARRAEQGAAALLEADRRKDEFLAMLAHELRNPLTPIRNVAHILARSPDAGTVRRAGEMLARQASHLAHLVDDLLDVARITHRRVQLKQEVLSLEGLVNLSTETVQPLLDARSQLITVSVSTPHIHVKGDEVRLCQVVSNLLSNASKYSPDGARIHLGIGGGTRDALLTVRDEGYGIDRELLPRVFDLFMQGDRSLDRAQGGLGLGLTIVRHLVDMHGGSVEASSEGLGRGSEFRVRLPRVMDAPSREPAQQRDLQRRRRRRVLVVDDNADCANSLRDVLHLDGHDIAVARDGPAALTHLEDFPADIVLLDVGLPRIDGYMVAHAIRARYAARRSRPRLVALTGHGRDEDRLAALRSGFDDHLTKPVDPERLLRVVSEGSHLRSVREDVR